MLRECLASQGEAFEHAGVTHTWHACYALKTQEMRHSCSAFVIALQGWADLSNHVLRCHLPLIVPTVSTIDTTGLASAASTLSATCGIVVDNKVTHHREGELIVFDDSKKHYAFNNHATHSRVVLIFDIARPDGAPPGEAKGATTKELEGFIDYFK